jgi:hypothetical protein
MNQQEINRQRIQADMEAFLNAGGSTYQAAMGESGRKEFFSGANRARAKSLVNKPTGGRPKKESSRWHVTRGNHPNSKRFNVT